MSSKNPHVGGKLAPYRQKRSAEKTHEPFGADTVERPHVFCVQKHAATRLHYDFRLEWGGVLLSWAVPRGPSLDPDDKRLAVHVEDHPVEYADYEGVIPDDNYGAGPVIVWDIGTWVPIEDPDAGMKSGKLLFDLQGHKLRGRFTLVRTKRRGQETQKEWLLIKKPDGYARKGAAPPETSVLSGRTIEEVREGKSHLDELRRDLAARGLPRRALGVDEVELMLAETSETPFSDAGWVFELKYDGYRLLAGKTAGAVKLRYRSGRDATPLYPDLARAVAALPAESFILDGEVVVHDEAGRPSFARLQQRAMLSRPRDVERAAAQHPAVLETFDLLAFEGQDLRKLPLIERKAFLKRLLPAVGVLHYADHIEEKGRELYAEVQKLGLEGLLAKKRDAPYRGGRTADWKKIKVQRTLDLAIVGFTIPKGSRDGHGGLHLAWFDPAAGTYRYAGRVGSGLTDEELARLRARLESLRRETPAFTGEYMERAITVLTEPEVVCEVRYGDWTPDAQLRHPVFLRLRTDKRPIECTLPHGDEPAPFHPVTPDEPAPATAPAPEGPRVQLSNLDKVFWPEDGYTKGDLLDYYRAIAPFMLRYLGDRPVMLTRYPDGIHGKSFFQKDAPGFTPTWLRTERMWSEDAQRDIDQFVCDDVEMLLYLVNLGTIPLHVWGSRVGSLQKPDWVVLDLDPKVAPFSDVIELARETRALCDEIGLPAYPKTSGSSGLHVLIPLGRQVTYEQARQLAALLAKAIVARRPDIATVARAIGARGGRVYIDWLQNGYGKLIAAPFCVRPLPGAPVSMPLEWREVKAGLDPKRFTIKTAPARMRRKRGDPLAPILDDVPDLLGALGRLQALL